MAKKTVSKKPSAKTTLPSTKSRSAVPALKLGDAPALPKGYQNRGVGASTRAEDQQIPIIGVIQTLSPQLKKNKPEYIEGAKVGQFLFKNSMPPVRDGDEGFYFIPSYFKTMEYVEWVPRDSGGGYVGRHATLPAGVKTVKDAKNPNKMRHVGKNGNEFIETRYVFGQALDINLNPIGSFVIPFSSTGHGVWKKWNQSALNKRIETDEGEVPADIWLFVYKLTTEERSNPAGDWYQIAVEDAGWNTSEDLIRAGAMLHDQVDSGEKVAGAEDRSSSVASDDDGAM